MVGPSRENLLPHIHQSLLFLLAKIKPGPGADPSVAVRGSWLVARGAWRLDSI